MANLRIGMLDLSLDEIIVNSMIYICGSRKLKWQKSVELAKRMNVALVKQDVFTYNALLNSYEILGRWPDSVQFLAELQQQLGSDMKSRFDFMFFIFIYGIYPETVWKIHKRNLVLSSCILQIHLKVFLSARQQALSLDVISYNSTINAARGRWERALNLFHQVSSERLPGCERHILGEKRLIPERNSPFELIVGFDECGPH